MEKKPLSKAIKTFYGIGDFGFGLMASVELYFFVFFLTNVAKLSLPTVALISSITSIVDAVSSPFYGAIISGTKPLKWGAKSFLDIDNASACRNLLYIPI